MSSLVDFALGFLCACGIFGVMGIWRKSHPETYQAQVNEKGEKTVTIVKPPMFGSKPDNQKAQRYATSAYKSEMEEVITRGEGYPE